MSLPVVAPGEQVMELMIPASKVGLIIGKTSASFTEPTKLDLTCVSLFCSWTETVCISAMNFNVAGNGFTVFTRV